MEIIVHQCVVRSTIGYLSNNWASYYALFYLFNNMMSIIPLDSTTEYYVIWLALPDSVDFTSFNKFKQSILHINYNDHLLCFKR